jgi:division protein CdvB (Snf7/Vps24/ESCRT-III family)
MTEASRVQKLLIQQNDEINRLRNYIKKLESANSDLANEFTAAASFLRQGTDRIEKLKAALREIADDGGKDLFISGRSAQRIARKALDAK